MYTIYGLIDPRTEELRYIGQSNNVKLRYSGHLSEKGNSRKCTWIKSLKNKGLKPILLEIERVSDWVSAEIFWIQYFKSIGCKLLNHTVGGEGSSGVKRSVSNIQKVVAAVQKTYKVSHPLAGDYMLVNFNEFARSIGKPNLNLASLKNRYRGWSFEVCGDTKLETLTPEIFHQYATWGVKPSRVINVMELSGNVFTIYNIPQWCKDNNLDPSGVYKVLKDKLPHYKGYRFMYA